MTVFAVLSFSEQGVYDVVSGKLNKLYQLRTNLKSSFLQVNNLGSMAARFLFLPIEESSYFYFAQMINRTVPIEKQPRCEVEQVAGVLRRLLRALTLLGAIIVVFGFSYSHLLLHLYGTYIA